MQEKKSQRNVGFYDTIVNCQFDVKRCIQYQLHSYIQFHHVAHLILQLQSALYLMTTSHALSQDQQFSHQHHHCQRVHDEVYHAAHAAYRFISHSISLHFQSHQFQHSAGPQAHHHHQEYASEQCEFFHGAQLCHHVGDAALNAVVVYVHHHDQLAHHCVQYIVQSEDLHHHIFHVHHHGAHTQLKHEGLLQDE